MVLTLQQVASTTEDGYNAHSMSKSLEHKQLFKMISLPHSLTHPLSLSLSLSLSHHLALTILHRLSPSFSFCLILSLSFSFTSSLQPPLSLTI